MKAKIIMATAIIGVTALAGVAYAGKERKENEQKIALTDMAAAVHPWNNTSGTEVPSFFTKITTPCGLIFSDLCDRIARSSRTRELVEPVQTSHAHRTRPSLRDFRATRTRAA